MQNSLRRSQAQPGQRSLAAPVGNFPSHYRRRIAALVRRGRCFADLAACFPGLIFALATGYGSEAEQAACVEVVESGGSLKSAAEALGLPLWLRRLPAEAFDAPLVAVPCGSTFASHIVNYVPESPQQSALWLERVLFASQTCGEEFAFWMGRQRRLIGSPRESTAIQFLGAWAWFSLNTETRGHGLLRRPWQPSMGLARAVEEMQVWRRRIDLALKLAVICPDAWLQDGTALGFDIVRLKDVGEFVAEAKSMQNCLDQYADQFDEWSARIFSIRNKGTRVATLELAAEISNGGLPNIAQLRGVRNRQVSPEVWQAVFLWLGSQRLRPIPAPRSAREIAHARVELAQAIWQPYVEAISGTRFAEQFLGKIAEHASSNRLRLNSVVPARRRTARRPVALARPVAV
ncbi:MAG: PcfJ domain-containing protein [Hyphomicrobiaceae bacterium]